MTKNYDRRAPEALLSALEKGGFSHALVEYANSGMWGLDLQFRGLAPKTGRWATLYVGTTKVLDLHVNLKDQFKLSAHASYATKKNGWDDSWTTWRTPEALADCWHDVGYYLESAIAQVIDGKKHLKEGIVQAAISQRGGGIVMIDREAVVGYTNDAERKSHETKVARPLIAAAAKSDAPQWWTSGQPKGANRECDLLGIDRDGGLVAIEVKPATASASSIAWSPIQARMYATFFQDWLDANRSEAAAIVAGMIDQRRRVGLSAGGRAAHLDVGRPVRALVAVDSRLSDVARTRMAEVIRHYDEVGHPLGVEVMSVNLIGRFKRLQF